MAFTRRSLAALGLSEEQVEKVMTLHGTSMSDFIPKSELQGKINEALEEAQKKAPVPDIKNSEDYKALQKEFDGYKHKIETSAELKKGGVKDKFIDQVFSLLEEGKPASEQLDAIKEKYDSQGRPSKKYIGEKATVAVNPENGNIVTVHGTHTKLLNKLKGEKK